MSGTPSSTVVLGLNAFTPNSSASLFVQGQYIGSAEEERFAGPKRAAVWPTESIQFLLAKGGVNSHDVTDVALNFSPDAYSRPVHDDSFAASVVEQRDLAFSAARGRLDDRLSHAELLFPTARVVGIPHHRAHAAYAFAASGFEDAAVLILDSVGEVTASSIWDSNHGVLGKEATWSGPDYSSVGYFYGAITTHLGWKANDEEGTVMALAALGDPVPYRSLVNQLIQLRDDELWIDPTLLPTRVRRVRSGFTDEFISQSCPPRAASDPIDASHRNLAAAAQERLEDIVTQLAELALRLTGKRQLVFSGGVAENCVANGKLADMPMIDAFYVPPAPGDAGTSLGAALALRLTPLDATALEISNPLVGASMDATALNRFFVRTASALEVGEAAAQLVEWCDEGLIVGLVRGRFEFGPRALGNRSIIASPVVEGVTERLNRMVKHREPFRPFAPVVRLESVESIFELPHATVDLSSMSLALPVKKGLDRLGSVTHDNGLARVQTVTRSRNPVLWEALRIMDERDGLGVLINTSLNVKGQPICGTPALLEEFAAESAVQHFLIDETIYIYRQG
ncbi:carbamoyltransferase C-terminal domain-containing protein [Microbacterium gorillae]|uniref:carbamoyltransferase C-terminal domain-containing protein n=1 Tax=Microbacterium gorillae TaxID=1231063 RepID=UPI003D98E419